METISKLGRLFLCLFVTVCLCTKWDAIDAIKFFTDYHFENTLCIHNYILASDYCMMRCEKIFMYVGWLPLLQRRLRGNSAAEYLQQRGPGAECERRHCQRLQRKGAEHVVQHSKNG